MVLFMPTKAGQYVFINITLEEKKHFLHKKVAFQKNINKIKSLIRQEKLNPPLDRRIFLLKVYKIT